MSDGDIEPQGTVIRADPADFGPDVAIDPGAAAGAQLGDEPARTPGRRKRRDAGQPRARAGAAAGTRKKASGATLDLSAFSGMVLGVSTMLAMKWDMPEVMVSEGEADAWLKAVQNFARHYSIETTQKALDTAALVGVTIQVFGTRGVAVMAKNKMRKAGKGQPGNVVDATHIFNGAADFASQFDGSEP